MLSTSVEVICYKSKRLKDGTFPLMLRITKARKRKYIALGVSVEEKYWDFEKNKPKRNCPDKELIEKLIIAKETEYKETALELMANRREFTASSLVSKVERKINATTVKDVYERLISELADNSRLGNAAIYKYSYHTLQRFTNNTLDIPFMDINEEWLERYEKWLKRTCKDTTISIHFRTLRSVFNKALEADLIREESYPFKKFRLSRFDVTTKKRAISKEDILRIMSIDLSEADFYRQLAKDIFLFSYFGAGINFSDISLLRYSDIVDGRVHYIRKKTGKPISFPLLEDAKSIIAKYSKEKHSEADYIFPILDRKVHKTEMQKRNRIHKVIGHVNKQLKVLGEMAGIEHLTTYVARHSYATVLKRAGVSVELISETLGHSDLSTTQIYLDSFENSQIDKAMENLK